MKLLVTGGAGFIGSHLCDFLLSQGHQVISLDNLVNGKEENHEVASANPNFQFIKGDILNLDDCKAAVSEVDLVFHLACLGVRHSIHSPIENHEVNATGSLNILEASRQEGVKRFIYVSTSEIYGDIKSFPIAEDGVPLPKTVYGSSKLAGENYAYSYHICYGMDVTITRIFNNYGPRAHYEGDAGEVIPRNIVQILNGKRPVIFGDGGVTRDFFFVKDTAKALGRIMDQKKLAGQIINIGTGVEITMKHLLETLLELMGKSQELPIQYLPDRPADVPRLWVNPNKFRNLTGWSEMDAMNFEEGLKETIAYYSALNKDRDLLSEVKLNNWEK
ncbi:MAG: GDP-mannose 4,6-dehydratase [Luteibaculum sp.]